MGAVNHLDRFSIRAEKKLNIHRTDNFVICETKFRTKTYTKSNNPVAS